MQGKWVATEQVGACQSWTNEQNDVLRQITNECEDKVVEGTRRVAEESATEQSNNGPHFELLKRDFQKHLPHYEHDSDGVNPIGLLDSSDDKAFGVTPP